MKNEYFKDIVLREYIDTITDYHANGAYEKLKENITLKYTSDYAIMIRTLNFESNNFDSNLIYINQNEYEYLSKSKVYPDDIIMNKIANPGSVYIMPDLKQPVSLAMNLFLIRFKSTLNQKFMYYLMHHNEAYIKQFTNGTTTKTITKDAVRDLKFYVPEKSIQQKIANVLSSLDSKIELNNKINKELEAMAKTLYDYWFVQFDFPEENGKPYKSSGGKMVYNQELKKEIPYGWEVENLASSTLTTMIIPKIEKFDFEKIYLSTSEVDKTKIINHEQKITFKDRPSRANMQPIKNSIWFARMKNTKKLILIGEYSKAIIDKYIFSTGFAGLSVRDNALYYVWNTINNDGFEDIKDTLASGSTQKAVTNEAISNIRLLVPNENILNQYTHILLPFFKKIYVNEQQNQELAKLRDWLLPMLMNEQVRVK